MQWHLQRQHASSIKMLYRQEQPLFYSSAVGRIPVCESIGVCRSFEAGSRRRLTGQVWQCDAFHNGTESLTGLAFLLPCKT